LRPNSASTAAAIRPSGQRHSRRAIVPLVESETLRKPFKALPGDLATGNEAGASPPAPSRNEIA
jgi:hypothetical protein